ncbi:MAG: hypothetical protein ICV66_06405 [Chitinophagaceae bacterium]|nr:hypothetical protein [Chitinophagaceae bacterium]
MDHYDKSRGLCYKAIAGKNYIEFGYTDKTSGVKGVRKIAPYVLGLLKNKEGEWNLYVSGYFMPTQEQLQNNMRSGHKNYFFSHITPDSLKILSEKFSKLETEPIKLYDIKIAIPLCVAYFPEDLENYLRFK